MPVLATRKIKVVCAAPAACLWVVVLFAVILVGLRGRAWASGSSVQRKRPGFWSKPFPAIESMGMGTMQTKIHDFKTKGLGLDGIQMQVRTYWRQSAERLNHELFFLNSRGLVRRELKSRLWDRRLKRLGRRGAWRRCLLNRGLRRLSRGSLRNSRSRLLSRGLRCRLGLRGSRLESVAEIRKQEALVSYGLTEARLVIGGCGRLPRICERGSRAGATPCQEKTEKTARRCFHSILLP